MCDIYMYDKDNFQVDGDTIHSTDLEKVKSWHDVRDLLGSNVVEQMKKSNFNPGDLVRFLPTVAMTEMI